MKKYANQSHIEPPLIEQDNLVMPNQKNIKTHCPAQNLDHNMYRPFEIIDIISLMAVCHRLRKSWKIYPVMYVSLIEPFVKSNCDVDLNTILKFSDYIENAPEYDTDKGIGSIAKDGEILYLSIFKGWPAKKQLTREPSASFYSLGIIKELRLFYSENPNTLKNTCLIVLVEVSSY
jgi:hypothetical protein